MDRWSYVVLAARRCGDTIALVDATATRGGKTFTYRTAEIYHIRDGKIAERWAFSDDTAAITAFFA